MWEARITITVGCLIAALSVCLPPAKAQSVYPNDGAHGSAPISTSQAVGGTELAQLGTGGCVSDAACDDGLACTRDACVQGTCANTEIPGCVPCIPERICEPVEIVFIMDTSGSMRDEAIALCSQIGDVLVRLDGLGVTVSLRILGITNTGDLSFNCLENDVVSLLGPEVPGTRDTCVFPDGGSSFESWGPAAAIVADRYPWIPGATRIAVPISDEGPCNGSRPDGCNDPGDDRDSITNAAHIAAGKGVIVSPVTGTGSDACVNALAESLAAQTGGIAIRTADANANVADAVVDIVLATCELDPTCDDQNICTDQDTCLEGRCLGTPNFDDAEFCCHRTTNELTLIDDGNNCTDDACDPATGAAMHTPNVQGTSCDDGDVCTYGDVCDGAGGCFGGDINELPCTSDDNCLGSSCNTKTGLCVCTSIPELCLSVLDPRSGESCYTVGETVVIDIELGYSTNVIAGASLYFHYNPNILQFESISPGVLADPSSPFELPLFGAVDEAAGTVYYAIGINIGGYGTHGPATMARVRFTALTPCQADELCWLNGNPKRTTLTDARGQAVPYEPCCSGEIFINASEVSLSCPDSAVRNVDPDSAGTTIRWNAPAASSDCQEHMQVSCTATHSSGLDILHLISGGGRFPVGRANFQCTAVDSCGAAAACSWTVEVKESTVFEFDLQLAPRMASEPDGSTLDRCIEFELFSNCVEEPIRIRQEVSFGPPFNLPGQAVGVLLDVPPGYYGCITARDPLHTLRSVAYPTIVGDHYHASFRDDPAFHGNWLVGGNLDGSSAIDAVDFGLFVEQYMTAQVADTACDESGVNADFNGDAFVDERDSLFISKNLYMTDMTPCCAPRTTATTDEVVFEISVAELAARGLERLSVADLNDDGLLNQQDVELFRARSVPPKSRLEGSSGSRSLRDPRGGGAKR